MFTSYFSSSLPLETLRLRWLRYSWLAPSKLGSDVQRATAAYLVGSRPSRLGQVAIVTDGNSTSS